MSLRPARVVVVASSLVLASSWGCGAGGVVQRAESGPSGARLEEVATSTRQWTGVAVAPDGRAFVSYPTWGDDVPLSVAEITSAGPRAYPDEAWNQRDASAPGSHFVAVQSVVATRGYLNDDSAATLWVLDTGNPHFAGVVPGAAKLVAFDLATGALRHVFPFDASLASEASYLNDVRFDLARGVAYLTDSGRGALVVYDLASESGRRVLDAHGSTDAEDTVVTVQGTAWLRGGAPARVPSDGIALSPDGATLYFQALTGRHLYRVDTASLRDAQLDDAALGARVVLVGEPGPADGLEADARGVFHTSLEESALVLVDAAGARTVLVRDERLAWPDSLAFGPDGSLWVTTSRIHEGRSPSGPYGLYRVAASELGSR